MDFDIPRELQDTIATMDAFIAAEIKPLEDANPQFFAFYLALQLYKSGAILQGVVKRALQGAGPAAWLAKAPVVGARAELALAVIEKSGR